MAGRIDCSPVLPNAVTMERAKTRKNAVRVSLGVCASVIA